MALHRRSPGGYIHAASRQQSAELLSHQLERSAAGAAADAPPDCREAVAVDVDVDVRDVVPEVAEDPVFDDDDADDDAAPPCTFPGEDVPAAGAAEAEAPDAVAAAAVVPGTSPPALLSGAGAVVDPVPAEVAGAASPEEGLVPGAPPSLPADAGVAAAVGAGLGVLAAAWAGAEAAEVGRAVMKLEVDFTSMQSRS